MNNITIIGIGKLGLCLALNFEKSGFNVLGVDKQEDYIFKLNDKSFLSEEPGVNDLLINSKNFKATNSIFDGINYSDFIFLVVATPSLMNGKYDHSQIENVISEITKLGPQKTTKNLIICCTTFPGYCEVLNAKIRHLNYNLFYNPEFIAQGEILKGQTNPDMILIGETNKIYGDALLKIQLKICENKPKICRMSLTEAEITKLSINCFLTTKISFANMIGDLCNKLNVSHDIVLESVGMDSRIGNKYLKWGYGFGGPCLPRDNKALGILCEENNINPTISKASDEYNKLHLNYQMEHVIENVKDKKITLTNVSFKKNSNIIEESQPLELANKLNDNGFTVTISDKIDVIEKVKEKYGDKFRYDIKNS